MTGPKPGAVAQAASIPEARFFRGVLPTLLGLAGVVAASALAPGVPYYLNLVMQAATYAIAVAGLVVILGYCGQISLAQAGFLGIGAYCVALGTVDHHLPFFAALFLGVLFAAACGFALGLASLRLGGHYLAMVTISFQVILALILTNRVDLTHGPDGIPNIPRPSLPGIDLTGGRAYLSLCLGVLVCVTFAIWRLKSTRLGRAMQAVRDNEIAAQTCGVDLFRAKVVAFTISAGLGGLGGALFAGAFSYISPDQFGFNESVVLLTMALLGGAESPLGALLGTCVLVLLPEWLRFLRQAYLAVYGAAVILIMIFLPRGVWGLAETALRRRTLVRGGGEPPLPLLSVKGEASPEILFGIQGLSKHFGGLRALDGVDLAVRRGTAHALIGPNGSGKTTFLNVTSGLYRATAGRIVFGGTDITTFAAHERTRHGLLRTFQNIRVFQGMTVLQNVMVGAERPGNDVKGSAAVVGRALAALDCVGLRHTAELPVTDLAYGHRRYVEIARALAGSPRVLLLDEPAAGLNLTEKQELGRVLVRLKGHGLTLLIIEHDMSLVEQVADHITVLNFGKRIADGTPRDVLSHPDVIAAYLGEPRAHDAA